MRLWEAAYSSENEGERVCSRQDRILRLGWLERPSMLEIELLSRIRVWRMGMEVMEMVVRLLLARLKVSRVGRWEEGLKVESSLSPEKLVGFW